MIEDPNPDPLEASKLEDTTGLCLSGGGFRAMIFHLGALWRINELGLLAKISRFSSVSGGSITNGMLACVWRKLNFDRSGVAAQFASLVAEPLLAFARTNMDVKAAAIGLLPTQSAAARASRAYDDALFHGVRLDELPVETPRFTFNATNLMSGGLFRMSPEYAADYRVGKISRPQFKLADVVAASAAFPPVISPLELEFGRQQVLDLPGTSLHRQPYTQKAILTDGGVYDNLGLETVWKRCKTVLASNAGRNVAAQQAPWHFWPSQLYRIIEVMLDQVESERERQLIALGQAKQRVVGYWSMQTDPTGYHVTPPGLPFGADDAVRSAGISTRLAALSVGQCELLVHHAYFLSDLAIRCYVDQTLPAPSAFPNVRELCR